MERYSFAGDFFTFQDSYEDQNRYLQELRRTTNSGKLGQALYFYFFYCLKVLGLVLCAL
jgi:hypothetical protein